MTRAQAEQKRYADQHRRDERFSVGDEVLLSTRDLALAADSNRQRASKLTARFVGPFRVTKAIGDNAYELALPANMRVHPVQNVSKLRRYRRSRADFSGRPTPPDRPGPEYTDATGRADFEVRAVLARREVGRNKRVEYLVHWKGYPQDEASWESATSLNCPDLLADFEADQLLAMVEYFGASGRADARDSEPPGRPAPKEGRL